MTGEKRGHAEGQMIDIPWQCEETGAQQLTNPAGLIHRASLLCLSTKKPHNTHMDMDIPEMSRAEQKLKDTVVQGPTIETRENFYCTAVSHVQERRAKTVRADYDYTWSLIAFTWVI